MSTRNTKRENFEVSPRQQAEIEALQSIIEAPSKKDALLMAVHLALHVANEIKGGSQLFVGRPGQEMKRLVVLGFEKPEAQKWLYLVEHPHPWKRQLFVKGRKLPAASVWIDMYTHDLSAEKAASNWDLPLEVVHEIVDYCESNKTLLEMEAAEELRILEDEGIGIASKSPRR